MDLSYRFPSQLGRYLGKRHLRPIRYAPIAALMHAVVVVVRRALVPAALGRVAASA